MRISSKFALTFGFSGLIIIFASFIIVSSSLTSKEALSTHARTIMENIASYTIDKAESHLQPAQNAVQLTQGLSQNDIVNHNKPNSLATYFYEQIYLYPQFSGIYYGNIDGSFVMSSRYNQLEKDGYYTKIIHTKNNQRKVELIYKSSTGRLLKHQTDPTDQYDPRKRPWFRKAKRTNAPTWTDPYIFYTTKKPGITAASPVHDSNGNFLGVVGVDIGIENLSSFISKLKIGAHGRAFILSQNGDVVAYPDLNKILRIGESGENRLTKIIELDDPVTREAFLSLGLPHDKLYLEKPVFTSFFMDGEKYNAMFAPFSDPQWPWVIGIYMPEDDYLGAIKNNTTTNIIISLVMVAIALFIGMIVARRLNLAKETAQSADMAKSHFLTRMSHEIRTPMNAILGAGELLSETRLNGDQKRYVAIYRSAGEHLRELVTSVLDLSKIESGNFKLENTPFNLKEIVTNTCTVFTLEARNKGLDLSHTIQPDTPDHFIGDPTALKQILVNLISNAIKFTPAGSVTLTVKPTVRGGQDQGWATLKFSVSDTGIGIPWSKQKMIFERFTQADGSTSRKYGGTGLGLAICRNMTSLMGGEMALSSEPGAGSTFSFTAHLRLDLEFDDPKKATTHVQATQATSEHKRILLVEDDERNRLLFTMFLKDIPHTLETAENGEEALSKHLSRPYDLILMDIEMPGMDGHEATKRIREHEKSNDLAPVAIIAVTAHAIQEEKEKCKECGCTGYLSKPVTKAMLRETVAHHLDTPPDPKGHGE